VVEHFIDVERATGSSPVPRTKKTLHRFIFISSNMIKKKKTNQIKIDKSKYLGALKDDIKITTKEYLKIRKKEAKL
jgi:hypothetical protein